MSYTPYYETKWQSGEEGKTPITPAALNYMENGIVTAHEAAEAALQKAGGTMTGMLKLTEGVHYGTTLPGAGNTGRIFFKVVG
jgi:hypothetical protein